MDCVCSMFIRHIQHKHSGNSLGQFAAEYKPDFKDYMVCSCECIFSKQILMKRTITRTDFAGPLFLFNNFPLYVRMYIHTHAYVQVYHITVLAQF